MTSLTIDTNLFIYSVDLRGPSKHRVAGEILNLMVTNRSTMLLQCLHEFYAATTRKHLLTPAASQEIVERALRSFQIVSAQPVDTMAAMHLHHRHHLQIFDCLMIATTRRAGCRVLLTEDMRSGQTLDGITLLNPFLLSAAELDRLLV